MLDAKEKGIIRLMNRKFQVFISSTYKDLLKERQTAVQAVLDAGHIPAGMELFAAGDEGQLAVIKRWIDESDIYMLILGVRYGSIEPISKKSYTQIEYEYALEQGKPLFAVYLSDGAFKERVKELALELADEDRKGYAGFRDTVKSKVCSEFTDWRDITIAVLKTLNDFARKPALHTVGWIRSRDSLDTNKLTNENARLHESISKLIENISNLKEENNALRAQLEGKRSHEQDAALNTAMKFKRNAYWKETTDSGSDGPYCSKCWDAERKQVRLTQHKGQNPSCPNCKNYFDTSGRIS